MQTSKIKVINLNSWLKIAGVRTHELEDSSEDNRLKKMERKKDRKTVKDICEIMMESHTCVIGLPEIE